MTLGGLTETLPQTARRLGSLSFVVAAITRVVVGPQWPGRVTSLMCGESAETITEKSLFADMDACVVTMSNAADAGMHCSCIVKENRFAPAYYLVLVPIGFVAAVWMLSAATGRGMAAVVIVIVAVLSIPGPVVFWMDRAGFRIPNLLATIDIVWSQIVFFGPTMFWAEPRAGLVIPHQWVLLVTLAFWIVAAFAFGLLARRLRSPAALLGGAVGFVAGTALAVRVVAPLFNWRMLMTFP